MQRSAALAIVAAAVLAVPAGYGAVSLGPQLIAPPAAPPPATDANAAQEWTGVVAPEVLRGTIDVRLPYGNIHLVGAEGDGYSFQLLASQQSDGLGFGERQVEPLFSEEIDEEGVLHLALTVVEKGSGFTLNQDQEIAVVASVPSRLDWDLVSLCSAVGFAAYDRKDPQTEGGDCSEAQSGPRGGFHIGGSAASLDVPFLAEGLRGGFLQMHTNNADLGAADVVFQAAQLVTNNGNVQFAGDGTELHLVSNNGDVDATLTNAASARASLLSNNGNVQARVPVADERGYQVDATTNNGEITIDLPDMEQAEDTGEDDGTSADLASLPIFQPRPPKEGQQDVHAQSEGFRELPVQTVLSLVTNNGDIFVGPIEPAEA
jgi:hypothetical protein